MSSKRSSNTSSNQLASGAATSSLLASNTRTNRSSATTTSASTTATPSSTSQLRTNVVPPSSINEQTDLDIDINIKLESAGSLVHRLKKRPISGVLNSETDAELTCPICFDFIDVAHVTRCGHSFCQLCIQTALEHTHRCPKCNTPCSMQKDVFPNFTLNQIIEKYKDETNNKKCKLTQHNTSNLLDILASSQDELDLDSVNQLIRLLAHRKEELKYSNKKVIELLLYDFLKHLHQTKSEELNRIKYELHMVNEDCKIVEECLASLKASSSEMIEENSAASTKSESHTEQTNSEEDQNLSELNLNSQSTKSGLQSAGTPSANKTSSLNPLSPLSILISNDQKMQTLLNSKKRVIHRYFDELSQTYIQSHNRDFSDFNLKGTALNSGGQNSALDKIRQTVSKITHYSEFRSIASVNYNSDSFTTSSIVSSVDFDRSYEHFAMAGVTKRIKIFDFQNILDRPVGVHYPLSEMTHTAKLSCVNWNRYFRQQLACSDYEGVVTVWDAEQGKCIQSFQEHEKRCWGVQFCQVDPRLLASGSDDSKVKIWSTNSDYSLMSIDAKSNVCCVIFKPDSKYHVLFGTADHTVHYYDIRNHKEPVALFRGHRKAVSYAKFTSENEFVTASTDSTLKLWKLNEGQCVRTFTGHQNEKNFVGLETHNGYIVTGSENNTVYLYANELSKPLMTYKFEESASSTTSGAAGSQKKEEGGVSDFVSAVCWSNTNHLLAANSQGVVKVLELV